MYFKRGWAYFHLHMGFKLDIMTAVKVLDRTGFADCFTYAIVAETETVPVRFLHYYHLIACKKATGLLQVLLNIVELEK